MGKRWMGSPPATCDLCKAKIGKEFIDGRTLGGRWAIMCATCHANSGMGLGIGKGQAYLLCRGERHDNRDAAWLKIAG